MLVPKRNNLKEIFQLSETDQQSFNSESSFLSEQLFSMFNADKMNVAALGNMCPQLHVHHIVRYTTDLAWPGPIWGKVPMKPYTKDELSTLKEKIKHSLNNRFTF